ncbi:MAG: alpha/beta fold hydrolase, partial [Solirubrobacteraceae bacterium]|nr:alpha/beta fold hydrolase [Solirubrobacteraceae bacterium]
MDPSLRPSPRSSGLTPKTAAAATVAGILFGTLVGLLLPRGPVTVGQAVLLLLVSLSIGIGSGLGLQTRWAMVLLPLGYVVGFEVAWLPSAGLTTDAIDVGSPFGVLALLAGRGFHGLLTLAPMIVGAAWSAGYRRQQAGPSAPERRGGRMWLAIRRAVAGAAVVGVAVLLAALLRPASVPPLTTADGEPVPGSVSELVKVPSPGGIDQWLSIRGADPEAPVMLYLPGGPGQSDLGLSRALLQDLTGDVVVATLDGRGIGKAYRSFDDDPTVDEAVDDVVAATDYLRRRFDEDRIFLFGESGGTVTGVLAVQRHPERFLGWIGSGQMVDPLET